VPNPRDPVDWWLLLAMDINVFHPSLIVYWDRGGAGRAVSFAHHKHVKFAVVLCCGI
jgi:hypothetical protein